MKIVRPMQPGSEKTIISIGALATPTSLCCPFPYFHTPDNIEMLSPNPTKTAFFLLLGFAISIVIFGVLKSALIEL